MVEGVHALGTVRRGAVRCGVRALSGAPTASTYHGVTVLLFLSQVQDCALVCDWSLKSAPPRRPAWPTHSENRQTLHPSMRIPAACTWQSSWDSDVHIHWCSSCCTVKTSPITWGLWMTHPNHTFFVSPSHYPLLAYKPRPYTIKNQKQNPHC